MPKSDLLTPRLRCEPLRAEHAQAVWKPLQNPLIYTYLPDDPPSRLALQTRYDFLSHGRSPDGAQIWLNWIAFHRASSTPIGTFQVTLPQGQTGTFAYVIFPSFWSKGYGTEMARCVLTHVFDTYPVMEMHADIDTRNEASIRWVEALGCQRVKTTLRADFFKGQSSDEVTYSIDRNGWHTHESKSLDRVH